LWGEVSLAGSLRRWAGVGWGVCLEFVARGSWWMFGGLVGAVDGWGLGGDLAEVFCGVCGS